MTNADLEKMVDTTDEWIISRTGIRERRVADGNTHVSDMAAAACKNALEKANLSSEDIDLLILATVTPDYRLPSSACVVQEKMNLCNAAAFDVVSACTGFINGLSIASSLIETGVHKKALVVGSEKLSSIINYEDRNTCVLFGDGAGAAVLERTEEDRGVISTFLKSNGNLRKWLWIESGGTVRPVKQDFEFDNSDKISMYGTEIFKLAVREMGQAAVAALDIAGVDASEISLIVPHQANIRIIEALAKRLKINMDKVYLNIQNYGNTSAASVPIALDEAVSEGRIKKDDYVLMVAFGGGLIWGSALVRW